MDFSRWIAVCAVYLPMFFCLGLGPGFPGLFRDFAERGLFSNRCAPTAASMEGKSSGNWTHSSTSAQGSSSMSEAGECSQQQEAMALVVNITLSALNVCSVLAGLAVHHWCPQRMGIIALLIWTVAFSCGGILPENGIFWSGSFFICNICCNFFFFAILTGYVPHSTRGDEHAFNVQAALVTGIWDASIALNFAFHAVLTTEALASAPLWILFLVYGVATGIPFTCFVLVMYRDVLFRDSEATSTGVQAETHTPSSPPAAPREGVLAETWAVLSRWRRDRRFWIGVCYNTVAVTFGYYFTANTEVWASRGDLSVEQTRLVTALFPCFLGVGFIIAAVPGAAINKFKRAHGQQLSTGLLMTILVAICILVVVSDGGNFTQHIITSALFGLWRTLSFASGNTYFTVVIKDESSGAALGLAYTIGGLISLPIGAVATMWVQEQPEVSRFVTAGLIALSLLVYCIPLTQLATVVDANDSVNRSSEEPITPDERSTLL